MLSKEKTRKAFSRAAFQYDQYATWQQKIARHLVAQVTWTPQNVLDLGCGTGEVAFLLKNKFPRCEIHGLDLAEGMISAAQKRSLLENKPDITFLVGDMEKIDFPAESFDLVISSLSLQWLNDPSQCFQEVFRVLKPKGIFIFSLPIKNSQKELVEAYKKAFGEFSHRHNFPGKTELLGALRKNKYKKIKSLEFTDTIYFDDLKQLAQSMKNVGAKAQNSLFLTKTKMNNLAQSYPLQNGRLPLTYRILCCCARRLK